MSTKETSHRSSGDKKTTWVRTTTRSDGSKTIVTSRGTEDLLGRRSANIVSVTKVDKYGNSTTKSR